MIGMAFGGIVGLAKWGFKNAAKKATKKLTKSCLKGLAFKIGLYYFTYCRCIRWEIRRMVSKLKKTLNKFMIYLIFILIVLLFVNLCLMNIFKYYKFDVFEQVCSYTFTNTIVVYFLSYFAAEKYYKSKKISFDNSDSKETFLLQHKIKKPFCKEIDMCYITSETSYISKVCNIMLGLSICSIMLITIITFNIDESLNYTSFIIASIIYYVIIIFHIVIDEYNEFCKYVCDLIIDESPTIIISDSLDETVMRNGSKIKKIIIFVVSVIIINTLSILFNKF